MCFLNSQTVIASTCSASPRRCCKEAAFGRSRLSTQGCQNREDLGGNTSNEFKAPLTHGKNCLASAGAPDLTMEEKDSGLSATQGCLLPSAFAVARSTAGSLAMPVLQQLPMFHAAARVVTSPSLHLGCCKCANVC